VLDREEGGAEALSKKGVHLQALYTASELVGNTANPHG
jgi:orotate phosphoribosyltransferase